MYKILLNHQTKKMELNQEIKLNITPDKAESLVKISLLAVSTVTLMASVFFTIITLVNLTKTKQPVASTQILNINQITEAAKLISEKTIDFSQTK